MIGHVGVPRNKRDENKLQQRAAKKPSRSVALKGWALRVCVCVCVCVRMAVNRNLGSASLCKNSWISTVRKGIFGYAHQQQSITQHPQSVRTSSLNLLVTWYIRTYRATPRHPLFACRSATEALPLLPLLLLLLSVVAVRSFPAMNNARATYSKQHHSTPLLLFQSARVIPRVPPPTQGGASGGL